MKKNVENTVRATSLLHKIHKIYVLHTQYQKQLTHVFCHAALIIITLPVEEPLC